MEVKLKLDANTGKYVLVDKNEAEFLFDAIVASFDKDELKDLDRCPMCRKKTDAKMHTYIPSRHMVEVLFEMARVMKADPEQNGYVLHLKKVFQY